MNWLLKRHIDRLAKNARPERAFVRRLERQLRVQTGHQLWWIQSWKWAVASFTMLSIIGSATSVYAYTSDDVLPDHPLYALRQGIETVEIATAATPERQAEVQVRLLKRRLHEAEIMTKKHKTIPAKQLEVFTKNVQQAIDAGSALSDQKQTEVDEMIERATEHHETVIQKQQDRAETADEKDHIGKVLRQERDGIQEKIQTLKDARKQHFIHAKEKTLFNKSDR